MPQPRRLTGLGRIVVGEEIKMYSKTKAGVSWGAIIGLMVAASISQAQIANGSFEGGGGSFNGWTQTGDTQIETSSLGSGPISGMYQALIATYTDGTVNSAVAAGTGVSGSALDTALNLSSPGLSGVGNGTPVLGSAITQSITLKAGDKVTFDWDFLTNQVYYDSADSLYQAPDPANNDFAFASLIAGINPGPIQKLADTFFGYSTASNAAGFVTGFTLTPAGDPFVSETDYQSGSLTAPADGTYLLGFGVVNATTNTTANGVNSALLVDNVQVQAVPEPSSYLALCVLGLGLGLSRRKA